MASKSLPTHLYMVISTTLGYEKEFKEHRYKTTQKTLGVFESLEKANKFAIAYAQQKYGAYYAPGWDFVKNYVDNACEPGIFYDKRGCFKMNVPPGPHKHRQCKWALMVSVNEHRIKYIGDEDSVDIEEEKLQEPIIGKTTSGKPVPKSEEPPFEEIMAAQFGLCIPSKRPSSPPPPVKPHTTSDTAFVKKITFFELYVNQRWYGSDDDGDEPIDDFTQTTYFLTEKAARDAYKEDFFEFVRHSSSNYYRSKEEGKEYFYGKDLPDWEGDAYDDLSDSEDDGPVTNMTLKKTQFEVVFRKVPKKGKGNVEILGSPAKIEVADWDGTEEEYYRLVPGAADSKGETAPSNKKARTSTASKSGAAGDSKKKSTQPKEKAEDSAASKTKASIARKK